jgi:hypothetical protein
MPKAEKKPMQDSGNKYRREYRLRHQFGVVVAE